MNFMLARRLVAFLCLFGALTVAMGQMDPNAIIATVNGDQIKAAEYYHRMEWLRVDPKSPIASLPVGFLTIKQLITERLVFQMAKAKGAEPTGPEIDAELQREETADPNLLANLKKQGRQESDLRQEVAYNLAQFNLRTFGITITDQQVEQHYKDYPTEFITPKRYKLRVIVVTDDATQQAVDHALAAGKSFADVASADSLDASKYQGGEYGVVPVTSLAPETQAALAKTKIGSTTGWIQSGDKAGSARVKFLVEDALPQVQQPLTPTLIEQVRRKMMLDAGDVRNPVFKDLRTATLKATVVINQPEFQLLYDQMVKQLANEPVAG